MATAVTVSEKAYAVALEKLLTFRDIDCRRVPVRNVRRHAALLARDMGDDLSIAQQELVRRAAILSALLENSEARMLIGERVSVSEYVELLNAQRRILVTLGIRRVPRDITPTIEDIAREHRATEAA
jgi:hypothetical protein